MSDSKKEKKAEQELTPEQIEQNRKSASIVQSNLDTISDARGVRAAAAMLDESDGSTRVANEREEDCPAVIRAGSVAGIAVFVVCILIWFLAIANFLPSAAASNTTFLAILYTVMGVSFVVGVVCSFLQWRLNRRAWIRRMREQDAEKERARQERLQNEG